jgi:nucleotide-binding universal stress UspA family protein
MSYGTLMVHAVADNDGEARMALAANLAARFGAMLMGVAACDVPIPLAWPQSGAVVMSTMLEEQEAEIRQTLLAAQRSFHAALGSGGSNGRWASSIDLPTEALVREGRCADLIVVGRSPDTVQEGTVRHPDPGTVLMQAGRPLLVVPPGLSHLDATRVVIAWRDSRESRRAVHDALPFLKRASSVLLLQICRSDAEQAETARVLEDVAGSLVRNGVAVTADARVLRQATIMDELLLAVEQQRADLVVAGGYGHSRFNEWAFGGVTRTMLQQCPKCCLLSH